MFNKKEKIVLALMAGVNFCMIVDFMMILPLGPQLMRELAISTSSFSYLVMAHTLSAGLAGLFLIPYIDRWDARKVFLAGLVGVSLGALASASAPTYLMLLSARGFTGVFVGIVGSMIFTIVGEAIPIEKRGTGIGIVLSAFALAAILGVPIGLYLAKGYTWSYAFYFVSAITGLMLLLNWKTLPSFTRSPVRSTESFITGRTLAVVFVLFLILGNFTLMPFLFPSIIKNVGISENQLPVIYGVGGLAAVLASVIAGRLADIFGRKKIFTFCLVASLPVIYIITNLGPASVLMTATIIAFYYIAMSGRMATAITLVTATVSDDRRGSFMVFVNGLQNITVAIGALISGQIVTQNADGTLSNYPRVGWLAIICSLIALYLIFKVKVVEGKDH